MKVKYVNVKYKNSNRLYAFMTVYNNFVNGDILVTESDDFVTFDSYTDYSSKFEGKYKWVIGKVDFATMHMEHDYQLEYSNIDPKTGKKLKSNDDVVDDKIIFNGLKCSICGEPQFKTRGGDVCKNGHGDVEGI